MAYEFNQVTPTWVHPTTFDEFSVDTSISENFTREYFLTSTTPNRQYEFQFLGVRDEDFATILEHYRSVSGPYQAFNFMSFSPQFYSLFGEDLTPTTYRDSAPSNNTLGVTGAIVSKGAREKGWGIEFDGVNDYLEPDPSGATGVLDFDFWENFSIAFWAKFPSDQVNLDTVYNMIMMRGSSGSSYPYFISLYNSTTASNGKIIFARSDKTNSPGVLSTSTINDNRWHHIVGVRDTVGAASKLYMYVDGSLDGSVADTVVSQTTNVLDINIGRLYTGAYFLKGNLDQLIVYNIPLTAASVALLTAGTTTLTNKVAYWDFHDDVSMRGRWTAPPNFKPNAKNWNINMFFEKEV